MVRVDTIEEIQEKRDLEKAPTAENFSALDYTKAIASTLALDGGSIGSLIKDGRIGWLKYTENMSAGDLAKVITTLVIFSAVGNAKPTKSGAITFAKSKGNTVSESFKQKIEKAVEKYNEQPRGKQLQGLKKIRQSSVDALTSLLRDTKNKADIQTIKGELAEAAKKLNETKENIKAEVKRNADEAAQVERIKERVRQENQKTKFEKENDAKVSNYIKKKNAYDAKIKEILKNNPDAFKTEVSAKTAKQRREAEMRDIFRDPKEVAREQAEIARLKKEGLELEQEKGLIDSQAKQAEGKETGGADSKANESKTEKPNSERQGSKEVPTTTKAPSKKAPKKAPSKAPKKAPSKAPEKAPAKAPSKAPAKEPLVTRTGKIKPVDKVATVLAGAAAAAASGDGGDEEPPVIPMDLVEKGGFTTQTVNEGEPETQSTQQPTTKSTKTSGSGGRSGNQYSKFDIKNTIDVSNIDNLFIETLGLCEDSYEPEAAFDVDKYFIKGEFPVLFHFDGDTLYVVFRGTNNSMKTWSDGINSISNMITDVATWNGTGQDQKLNQYEVFKNILSEEIAKFSCHGGFAKTLSKYYQEIRTEMDKYSSTANHIVFTGHSAGGALATLCYYVYQNDRNTKDKINVEYTVTYGSPRCVINDTNNINKFNKTCPNMLRVFNINDIVSYLPFNKGNFMLKNIASGFVHVGKPFPLDSNVDDNSLNALVLLILKGQKDKYKQLIKNFTLDEIKENEVIKFITSDKYLSVLSGCVFQCYSNIGVKEKVPNEMITLYTQELFTNAEKILDYSEKCNLVQPLFISDILKQNPIGETPEQENLVISGIGGAVLGYNNISVASHLFPKYYENINKLVQREVNLKKSFLDPLEEEDEMYIIPPVPIVPSPEKISIDLMAEIEKDIESGYIQGITEGNFGDLIIYT